jgi:formamidopyrimidine-DNA glycosylase
MPELPEAEYMVRRLAEYAPGARIVSTRILRGGVAAPGLARHARGRIVRYARRAKNVLLHLETGWTVRIQLGMTGHVFWIPDAGAPPPHTRVLFRLDDGAGIAFEDARVFGAVEIHREESLREVFADYGPEPLDPAFSWRDLSRAAGGLSCGIKPFLMDQKRLAGLGNIWAAEALFAARVHPARPAGKVTAPEWRRLHAAIRRTLARAIRNAFRVTARPDEFPEADLLRLAVYGRAGAPCPRCGRAIERTVQAGRATFFCPHCQPE